eukprot:COSAG02_NODE_224_length_28285_cov_39.533066_4_plen_511_part_00
MPSAHGPAVRSYGSRSGDRTTTYDSRFQYEYGDESSDDEYSDEDIENPHHTSTRKAKQLRGHGHSVMGRASHRDRSGLSRSPDGSHTRTDRRLSSPLRGTSVVVDSPLSPRKSFASIARSAAQVNRTKERLASVGGVGVPKHAFLRVNIMDVPHYADDVKEATVKLYIDVSWRARDMARHLHLKPKPAQGNYKWSNTDDNPDNQVPKEFYDHCPIEFPGVGQKHHVSNFVENHVASDVETWEDWFEMDANSEKRFLTMDEPLDPQGELLHHSSRFCVFACAGSNLLVLAHPFLSGNVTCAALPPGGRGLGIGDDKGIRWLSYRGKGTIKLTLTDLNLRAYPFDTQTIHVTVWHKNDWKLVPSRCVEGIDTPERSYASTYDQKKLEASMEGFQCCDAVPTMGEPGYPHKKMSDVTRKAHDRVRPALTIGVRMRRKPEFFYFNYFGPLFLIGNLNLVALVIPPEDLSTRSQIILTLILTIVAFKMTISQMLPRLPYPTILDKCVGTLSPHLC